jgi:triosephosphate isomerase (TIM)
MVIAYEPVWAISDGTNFKEHIVAKPDQAADSVKYIRSYVSDVFGERAGKEVRVIYGGSTVPDIVSGFLDVPGVDGFLVGGASLNYHLFAEIIEAAYRWQRQGKEED